MSDKQSIERLEKQGVLNSLGFKQAMEEWEKGETIAVEVNGKLISMTDFLCANPEWLDKP